MPNVTDYHIVGDANALERAGLFVAEGRLVVERLLGDRRYRVHSVLVTAGAALAMRDLLDRRPDVEVIVGDPGEIRSVTGFNFHRGCLALAYRQAPALTLEVLARATRILAIEGVGNPDNIGGLFRSALALRMGAVLLDVTAADPLYRKATRTSMAATLRLPYSREPDLPDTLGRLRACGARVIALTPDPRATSIDEVALDGSSRVVLLVGSESDGLSQAAFAQADLRVGIPVDPRADSLNVVAAASIAMHALRHK